MSAISEVVHTAEAHVLRLFAQHEATTLSTSLLFDEAAPFQPSDIARALAQLEHGEHILIRYTWGGSDWVTLTLRGVARRQSGARQKSSGRPEILYEHPHRIRAGGQEYNVYVLGVGRADGTWVGWIEFVSIDGGWRLRTRQETSQPNRDALAYWATGLEDVYLDGAIGRATS